MAGAESYLFGGEEVALVVRPHAIVLAKPALAPLAAIALFTAKPNHFTFVCLLVIFARFSWDFGLWWLDRYVLTTNRIISTSGILTKQVMTLPLAKITDLTFSKSIMGRLLGYGKLHLESAGLVGLESIDYLPDPDRFYRAVMALALGPPSPPKPDDAFQDPNEELKAERNPNGQHPEREDATREEATAAMPAVRSSED